MAVESRHQTSWELDSPTQGDKIIIPYIKVLKFSYNDFKPDRRKKIKARINTLIEKILICPPMRSGYIQEINRLILIERGEIK